MNKYAFLNALSYILLCDKNSCLQCITIIILAQFGPSAFKSKQAAEWSRLLFKCIKPVGEPDFQLNGDIGKSIS